MKKLITILILLVNVVVYSQYASVDMSGNFTITSLGSYWGYEYKPSSSSTFTVSGMTLNNAVLKLNPFISWDFNRCSYNYLGQPSSWTGAIVYNNTYQSISKNAGYSYNFDGSDISEGWRGYRIENTTSTYDSNLLEVTNIKNGTTGESLYMGWQNSYGLMLVSPKITDLGTDKKFSIYANCQTLGSNTIVLGTISDPNDPSTFHPLKTATISVGQVFQKIEVLLNNYVSQDQYIAIKNSGSSSDVYLDDFKYEQTVNCLDISNFSVSNIYETSAQINFDALGQNSWELSVKNMLTGQTQSLSINQSPYVLNNLSGNTNYQIKLRANCAPGVNSNWTSTLNFLTPCNNISAGYSTNFDEFSYLNPCWSTITSQTTSDLTLSGSTGTTQAFSGTNFIYFQPETTATVNTLLISPYISDLDNNKRIRFMLYDEKRNDFLKHSITIGTMLNPTDANTFIPIQTINPEIINPIGIFEFGSFWQQFIVNFSNYNQTNNHHYIAFKLNNQYQTSTTKISLDDFHYEDNPTCDEPTNLQVVNYEHDSATISWTNNPNSNANQWEIQYGPSGFAIGTGTIVSATSTQFTINSNLSPSTAYDYYVRSVCISGNSSWSSKGYFKTRCEGIAVGYTTSFENEAFIDNSTCWRRLTPSIRDYFWNEGYFLDVHSYPQVSVNAHTGTKLLLQRGGADSPDTNEQDKVILVTPKLIDFDNSKKVSFWLYLPNDNYSTLQTIVFGTLSNPNDYTSFIPFQTISSPFTLSQWVNYIVDFSSYYGTDKFVGIKQSSSNGNYMFYIDDFEYLENDCKKPTSLMAQQSGTSSISLNWSSNVAINASSTWQIEYGESGFTPGTGTLLTVNSNPYILSGLETFKNYQFRVRNICGNNFVNWSNLYSFNITCEKTAPFYENFDQYNVVNYPGTSLAYIPNFCWTINDFQVASVTNYSLNNINSAPNSAYIEFSQQQGKGGVLVSPYLSDFNNTKRIKFWVNQVDYNRNCNIIVGTITNPLDLSTFTQYQVISLTDLPLYGKEYIVDFTGYTGQDKHFAFMIQNLSAGNDSHYFIDDVYYEAIPNCLEPYDIKFLNISSNSTLIQWSTSNTNQNIQIEYGPTGFTQGTGTIISTNQNEYLVSNLQESSNYDFYFKSICNTNSSLIVGPKKLTTTCTSYPLPWVEDFNNLSQYGQNILPSCFKYLSGNFILNSQAIDYSNYSNGNAYISSIATLNNIASGYDDTSFLQFQDVVNSTSFTTPMFNLYAGTTYKFSLKARKSYEYWYPTIPLKVGRGQEEHYMETNLNPIGTVGGEQYNDNSFYFTPLENGNYSYLFKFIYLSNELILDKFELDEGYNSVINNNIVFDFSNGIDSNLITEQTINSKIDLITGNFLRLSGSSSASLNYDVDLWKGNQDNITKVNFKVDALNFPHLYLRFNLKQTYNTNPQESAFRVIVNGVMIGDVIYPNSTNQDSFEIHQYNLDQFLGQTLRVSLQHIGKSNVGIGDNAFLSSIEVSSNELTTNEFEISGLKASPNPTKDKLTLVNIETINKIQISNISGQILSDFDEVNTNELVLDLSKYNNGVYFIKVFCGDKSKLLKIIKE